MLNRSTHAILSKVMKIKLLHDCPLIINSVNTLPIHIKNILTQIINGVQI